MRAAVATELSGIARVEITERPALEPAAADQVLVRVGAAGVGLWDVGMVSGSFPGVAAPFVPGQEIAGVVEAAAEGAGMQPGDAVFGSPWPDGGGFAELALVPAGRLALMPAGLDFPDAAGLPIAGGTAWEALVDRGRLQPGETVLITAAAGGVGSMAVQIAAARGARAVGVASRANHEFVRGLGADLVVDYHDPGWPDQVRAEVPGGADLLLDAVGGDTGERAIGAVRDGGRAMIIVFPGPQGPLERGITHEVFAASGGRPRLEELGRLVESGQLHAHVTSVLPLDQAREALAQVAGRHTRGKVVLRISH